jgi:hypothetical protein
VIQKETTRAAKKLVDRYFSNKWYSSNMCYIIRVGTSNDPEEHFEKSTTVEVLFMPKSVHGIWILSRDPVTLNQEVASQKY